MPYLDDTAAARRGYTLYPGKIPPATKVVHIMAAAGGRVVTPDEIAEVLGASVQAARRHMEALQASGFPIRPIFTRGYRLTKPLDLIMPDIIAERLKTSMMGRTVLLANRTASTNDDAKELVKSGYRSGTVFIAETQSGGKGRIGRQWSSPAGGIWMSVLLNPNVPSAMIPGLSLVVGYAVTTAIRDSLALDARLKWPNDVLVDGRKACGILCEMQQGEEEGTFDVVAGIGINANPRRDDFPGETRESAAILRELTGRVVDRNTLVAEVLNRLEAHYSTFLVSGLNNLAPAVAKVSAFLGETVTIGNPTAADRDEATGIFRGIDGDGRAILETPGGESRAFSAGDLSLRAQR